MKSKKPFALWSEDVIKKGLRNTILEQLGILNTLTLEDIVFNTGKSEKAILNVLNCLKNQGIVLELDSGEWTLPCHNSGK